jgi:hypothetical protein
MPMLIYTLVYAGTCLVGSVLLLVDWRPFVAYFEYFSGTDNPQLTNAEVATALTLLFAAPAAMWIGFLAVVYLPLPLVDRAAVRVARTRLDPPIALPLATFMLSLAVAVVSLADAGSFSRLGSWLHYTDWITARQTIFARISFAEFVNIYLFLPLSAAWIAVSVRPRRHGLLLIALTTTLAVGVQLLLFQKKAAIVATLIVLTAIALHVSGRVAAVRLRWAVPTSILAVAAVYFGLVVLPVYEQARQTVQTIVAAEGERSAPIPASPQQLARLRRLREELGLDNRTKALLIYALLSPMTRTSAASVYYADVFPQQHAFYGFGLGDGKPTDDTRVVWDYMNPTLPGGSVAAPYQFGMFALWGLAWAVVASAVAGAGLALLWRFVVEKYPTRDWQNLGASLIVLLALYLAIDSAQNSLLVSYGVIWGMLFVAAALIGVAAVRRAGLAFRTDASGAARSERPRTKPRI